MKKYLTAAVITLMASGGAFAQTNQPAPQATTGGAGSTTGQQMTAAQIKQKLESQGYSNINLSQSRSVASTGQQWTGTATKGGKQVSFSVDQNGNVAEK